MRRSELQRSALASCVWRLVALVGAAALPLLVGGCLPRENPDAGLDIPDGYRAGPRKPDKALPAVLWWRGFRSKQLTDLVEEALTSNLDIAAAVARIVQADAQSRIAGAPLLPGIDFECQRDALAGLAVDRQRFRIERPVRAHDLRHFAEREL